jgi:hypothetical protein
MSASLDGARAALPIRLMYVTLDRFTEAVARLSEMRRERLLRIVMSPQGPAALEIDNGAPDVPTPGEGLYADIQDTLAALLNNVTVEDFIGMRSAPRPPQFPEAEDGAISRAKFEAVAAAFSRAELMQRLRLRQTSGVHVLTAVNWEVLSKHDDSFPTSEDEPSLALQAQINITSERASDNPFVPDREVSVFVVHLDDLEYMLAKLEQLKVALVDMKEGVGDGDA